MVKLVKSNFKNIWHVQICRTWTLRSFCNSGSRFSFYKVNYYIPVSSLVICEKSILNELDRKVPGKSLLCKHVISCFLHVLVILFNFTVG